MNVRVGDTELQMRDVPDDGVLLAAIGELDIATAGDLQQLLAGVDARTPLDIDLTRVGFIDTFGVAPLVECTRRRQTAGDPPPRVQAASRVVRWFFANAHLDGTPVLNVAAWDALGAAVAADQRCEAW